MAASIAFLVLNLQCSSASSGNDNSIAVLKPARLIGDCQDLGIDSDGDGLDDLLAVDVRLNVLLSGEYSLNGYLYDSRNREVGWAIDHKMLSPGYNRMRLEFAGKDIQQHGSSGNFTLRNLSLFYGNSDTGMVIADQLQSDFTTSAYNFSQFAVSHPDEMTISGSGRGENLLEVSIRRVLPVVSGKYSLDIVGIHIPPISSPFSVSGSKYGYAYALEGASLPNKPNDFTVAASGVENLNIGLKKMQGTYGNSSNIWTGDKTRIWVSHQAKADDHGLATTTSDLISPGIYDVKIFGDAAENETEIDLTMSVTKKLIINGPFNLVINTTGFPSGSYRVSAKALNGSFSFDKIDFRDQEGR
ncbi:hypothetical protein [Methanothrix sp.]|uniref:hypothetical protein n=1 Tax=Methanothrix sp. TaxID=90426 RepID=UPI00329946F4